MSDSKQKVSNDGSVIWQIDRRSKVGFYKINMDSSQFKYCEHVDLIGFECLPSGLWREGYGLTAAGSFLLQELFEKFAKKILLTLTAKGSAHLDGRGSKMKVTIPIHELSLLNHGVRATKRKRNEESRAKVRGFLASQFSQFSEFSDSRPRYVPGLLAEILAHDDVVSSLGREDRERLLEFIPEYLSRVPGTLRAKKQLAVVSQALDAGRKVFLEKIVTDFEKRLQVSSSSESTWQKFLSDYILVLRNNYGEVLEKESVSLAGKFPDFMLIDPYSYLDIFEIKKPDTNLLKHDGSRDNYYWDSELAKAISQVENYLYQAQRNSASLAEDIKKHHGIDVSIVRPRGYIIAGVRSQLTCDKMRDDFRILNDSLKNIDIIFYDELLANLQSFVSRLSTGGEKSS